MLCCCGLGMALLTFALFACSLRHSRFCGRKKSRFEHAAFRSDLRSEHLVLKITNHKQKFDNLYYVKLYLSVDNSTALATV